MYEEASSQGRSYMSYLEDRITKLSRQMAIPSDQSAQQVSGHFQPGQAVDELQYIDQGQQQADIQYREGDRSREADGQEELARALQGDMASKTRGVIDELKSLTDQSPAVLSNQSMHTPWNFRVSLLSMAGYRDDTGPFNVDTVLNRAVVVPLIQHYLAEIYPTTPFISSVGLVKASELYLSNKATSDETFKVLMVMAISASDMSDHPSSLFSWNALKLFSTASYTASYDPDTMAGIELSLLVLQFATLNPSRMNAWYLSNLVTRACASLGLNRETIAAEVDPDLSSEQEELRIDPLLSSVLNETCQNESLRGQRLFWTSYAYDRILAFTSGRPQSFDDAAVSIPSPSLADLDRKSGQEERLLSLMRRTMLIVLQSQVYDKLFHCDSQAPPSERESLALVSEKESEIDELYKQNPAGKAGEAFRLEIYSARIMLYRPCVALPRRSNEAIVKLASAASHYIDAIYMLSVGLPKKSCRSFTIARVFLATLSFIFSISRREILDDRSNSQLVSKTESTLTRACACIFLLSQELLVGQDLARRMVEIHSLFNDWLRSDRSEEFIFEEIRAFHTYHVGELQRDHTKDAGSWAKIMQQLLVGSDQAGDTEQGFLDGDQREVTGHVSSRESQVSTGSNQFAHHFTGSVNHPEVQYRENSQHGSFSQPAPYSHMSQFGVVAQPSQSYDFRENTTSHASSANAVGYTSHLPHQPRLQSVQQEATLTPLQQLAATAADHPGQSRHNQSGHYDHIRHNQQ